ncbi:MAG TPA: CrcB family protein [Devosiaceae bacterium]|jgi:CrcB protein
MNTSTPRLRRDVLAIYFAVGCGAGIGALLRYGAGLAATALDQPGFWATLGVNIVGSFVIGWFATFTAPGGRRPLPQVQRQFIMAGICGGLTTFSSLSLDTWVMLTGNGISPAALYLVGSLALSIGAAGLGYVIARRRSA